MARAITFLNFFVMFSHQIVGAVPVGIWTDGDHDAPYFPQMNSATYKEVWVHTTARFLWVLADIYGNAEVSGGVEETGRIMDEAGREIPLPVQEGRIEVSLPQGRYSFQIHGRPHEMDLISGGRYSLDGWEAQ